MINVWLITGANRGLGRAFAEEAVSHGDKVIAGMRRIPDDVFFRQENVLPVRMDVTKPDAVSSPYSFSSFAGTRFEIYSIFPLCTSS